jgi:hypothetical protein
MTATILRFPPVRTQAEQEAMDLKVTAMALGFDVEDHNASVLMRTFGLPAMKGTPETDSDPCVPFIDLPADCEYIAPDTDPA